VLNQPPSAAPLRVPPEGAGGDSGAGPGPRSSSPPDPLERAQRGLVAALAATCVVSIFAAQLFLVLALVVFAIRLFRGDAVLRRTPLDGPILAFCVWTLLSASFSREPLASHEEAKKLLLFALFYLALDTFAREECRERVLDGALLGGLALSAGALAQYFFLGYDTLNNRPRSFLGHYMTASGLVMAVLILAAGRAAFRGLPSLRLAGREVRVAAGVIAGVALLTGLQAAGLFAVEAERLFVAALAAGSALLALLRGPWPGRNAGTFLAALVLPLAAAALLISRTRNAWLGALVGLTVLAVMRIPRALWALAAVVGAVLVLRPAPVMDRLTVTDASSKDRYYMWQAGMDMIRAKPVFGQGPGMILTVYPDYRWPEAPNAMAPHLHDNALQIAAERGLPCLAWWLWWVAAAMGDAYRERRRGGNSAWVAAVAFAFLAAFMAAGLFEYNFGDSEIFMFALMLSALPYALRRQRDDAPAVAAA
jgi:O-antigen ligase